MDKTKVYLDHDGSMYESNLMALTESIKNIKTEGDVFWELSLGLIRDLNTSCEALGKPIIKYPTRYLRNRIKSS